ncbi:Transcription factor fungi [Macrophomina phaseolina MS6]|uniref:Transcription factor fungi n=1 Tax=Macrophomina phaseolina (strain MS6) TaxID=1126212 RepID=K2S812_MACPH|nr:Transcription factor fungi [Macrophomina phaseolina MS6]
MVERPQKPKRREEYVQALENRLSRIESLVQASGILDEGVGAVVPERRQPQSEDPFSLPPISIDSAHAGFSVDIHSVMADAELPGPMGPNRPGKMNSEFWRHCIRKANRRPDWINDIIEGVVSRGLGLADDPLQAPYSWSRYTQLPPMEDLLALVGDYFEMCNVVVPLYHQDTFIFQLYENLSSGSKPSAGWWASLNTVLALAHICRSRSTFFPQELEKKAWQYMKGALAIQAEQPSLDFDVTSVQALVGMALFFQITSFNSQMPSMMLATAIRIAQGIGLHMNSEDPNISAVEKEQRRRVFWIAYIFDRELSLRTGRPPVQDDDNMCLDLPQDNPPDKVGYLGDTHIFKAKCTLARIQGRVYKQLYADQAWKLSREDIFAAIGNLNQELEDWRLALPEELRPGHALPDLPQPYDSHLLVTHFCYWYCLGLINRRHAICTRITGGRPHEAVPKSISPVPFSSNVTDVARNIVELLRVHPPTARGTRWYTLYYCAAALVSLFGTIIANPGETATVPADLDRIRIVLRFLALICDDDNRDARALFDVCLRLEQMAVAVIEKAHQGESGATPEAERREQREELDRQVRKGLQWEGTNRFFSPLDI